jgi:hypothetical protein
MKKMKMAMAMAMKAIEESQKKIIINETLASMKAKIRSAKIMKCRNIVMKSTMAASISAISANNNGIEININEMK